MSSIITPEPGSRAAQALALSRIDGAKVDLKVVALQDGKYGISVGDADLTGFYEKIFPKSKSLGAYGGEDNYFLYDDWTNERTYFPTDEVEEEPVEDAVVAPMVAAQPDLTLWQKVKRLFFL